MHYVIGDIHNNNRKFTEMLEKIGFSQEDHFSNLYIAQVKRKCGIVERVNYNLPKSEKSKQPQYLPEKEKAIEEALWYFKMA